MNRAGYILLAILFAFSLRDIFAESHKEETHDADEFKSEFGDEEAGNLFSEGGEEDHIEVREQSEFVKPQQVVTAKDLPILRFAFCVSCGYKQAFDQFSQYVHEKYPSMEIQGSNYPPTPFKSYLAQFINVAKIALIAIIVTGSNPFAALGMQVPAVLQWAQSNKLSACMMIFLLSNMVEGTLMSTGAFEIFLGERQLWSKLESGRVPAPGELIQMIDSQLELLGKIPTSTGGFSGNFNE